VNPSALLDKDLLELFELFRAQNGQRIVDALKAFGFGSLDLSAQDFTADDRVIQLGRAPNRVDLLTRLYGVEFGAAWSRRVAARMGDVEVSMLSREDLIANKRATGRTQDIADAEFLERM